MAGAAFAATFTGILFLRQSDVLVGKPAVLVLAILLVMAPSSSLLSRRVFLNLLLLMGLSPLIWWVPERVTGIDHGSSVLAIAGGLVAACVFAEPSLLGGVRRLVPRVRFVDLLPLAGTLLSAAGLWTMLWISNAEGALSLFLTRWDYQSHFNIFEMLRQHGAVIPMIPRISPEVGWGFAEYPQGFHALVATLAELRERGVSSLELELTSFMQLQALVGVLTVALVLTGLCSLNVARRRAMVLAPVLAVTAAVWIYGPGSIPMYEGFANFYLACGMAVAAGVLLVMFHQRMPAIGMAALSAAIIGVFNNWFVLATLFAVPMAFFIWRKLTGLRVAAPRPRAKAALWFSVGVVGSVLPLVQAGPVIAQSAVVVNALGGIAEPDIGLALASISLALFAGFSAVGRFARISTKSDQFLASLCAIGVIFPVLLSIVLAISQIQQNGEIAYYFYKYVVAVVLFAWPAAALTFASLAGTQKGPFWSAQPKRSKLALGLLAASATQVFGFSATGLQDVGLAPTASPVVQLLQQQKHLETTPGHVTRLMTSANMAQPADTVYVASSPSIDPILAARWQWGMRAAATQKTTDMSSYLGRLRKVPGDDANVILELLRANDGTTVLVDAEQYPSLKSFLDSKGLGGRILPVS
ncbi:UNVERIFIED_ORG: hypothetical protein ABIB13_003373 [Arthrobacter sp. UYEF2]